MKKKLLSSKWVLPINEPAIYEGGVVVDGATITEVGPYEQLAEKYADAELQDFGRAVILPGFVDLHTHLERSGLRGSFDDVSYSEWKIQVTEKSRKLGKDDWMAFARLGAIETIQSGITTIADISESGAGLKAAIEVGLRGRIFCEIQGMDSSLVDEIVAQAKERVAEWRELAKDSRFEIGIGPSSTHSVCPPLIEKAGEWARQEKLWVCIHLAGSRDEHDFVKYGSSILAGRFREMMGWQDLLWQPTGVSPTKYLLQWGIFDNKVLAVHCVHVDEADIHILAEHNVAVAHCPRCNAKMAMGIAPLRAMVRLGLRVGLGTDSPASSNTMDFFDEMRMGLLFQRGINQTARQTEAESFVRMATLGGAEAIGLDDQIGSLEPGKQADIIVVDMSHSHQRPLTDPYSALVYTANQENIAMTMVGGEILYKDGVSSVVDEEEIMHAVDQIRASST